MGNTKTDTLIKELRKEKNMSQKDLAELLHITDRAVSKWERGICAPDISILEPLAETLNTTVTELISGERVNLTDLDPKQPASAAAAILPLPWKSFSASSVCINTCPACRLLERIRFKTSDLSSR